MPDEVSARPPAFLSIAKAAAELGLSRNGAYKQIEAGTFPVPIVKVGARMKVRAADLRRFIDGTAA